MGKYDRKLCQKCRVVFIPEVQEQVFCFRCACESKELEMKNKYHEMLKRTYNSDIVDLTCGYCGNVFKCRKRLQNKFCSHSCANHLYGRKKGADKYKKQIENSNERWVKGIKQEDNLKGKGPPMHVLNKIAEHERVYGKGAWDHYTKGRKWDRI